jgi:hypothetical protein
LIEAPSIMPISSWKRNHIDANATISKFGYSNFESIKPTDKVLVTCKSCSLPNLETTPASIRNRNKKEYYPICKSCQQKRTWASTNLKGTISGSISESMKKVWQNDSYSQNARLKASAAAKKLWQNEEYRDKIRKAISEKHKNDKYANRIKEVFSKNRLTATPPVITQEHRNKISTMSKLIWQNNEYRSKLLAKLRSTEFRQNMSITIKNKWQCPDYANKVSANFKSSLEDKLASILDDLRVNYIRQYHVGYWPFDFLIAHEPKNLLIEVHGDYWHGTKVDYNRSNDIAKASFIDRYHSDSFDLKVIWEHEFIAHNRIIDLVSRWLGLNAYPVEDFKLQDCAIKLCTTKEANLLLSKYHYMANGGRLGMSVGCYLNDTLVACAKFCNPNREQSATRLGLPQKHLKELTRFVIHPSYRKQNLASFFLSKAIKLIPCRHFITFADSTYGHNGTIYKAAGWSYDGSIKPDYYYVDKDGYVMHKRTLWGHAKRMQMSELEFANRNGYTKKFSKDKHRFILTK